MGTLNVIIDNDDKGHSVFVYNISNMSDIHREVGSHQGQGQAQKDLEMIR